MQRAVLTAAAVSACIAGACFGQGIACRYDLAATIAAPPGPFSDSPTYATAISPDGRYVVGYFRFNVVGDPRPFLFDLATQEFTAVPLPPWLLEASPADVNDHKIMVGTGVGPVAGQRGFVCDLNTGTWTELLPLNPPIGWSGATGINNQSIVCGFRSIGSKGDPVNPFQAFVFSQDTGFTDLGVMSGPNSTAMDIASAGAVVGWTGSNLVSTNTRAFVHANGKTTILPPVPNSVASAAFAVNDEGRIAIQARMSTTPLTIRGVLYVDGSYVDLGVPAGFDLTLVDDVGEHSVAVGTLRRLSPNLDHGFVWQQGVMRDLNDLLPAGSTTEILAAMAVSEGGHIAAGAGNLEGERISVVLSPVLVIGDSFPDCQINIDDLLAVIQWWGPGNSLGDVNGDGEVNVLDLLIVIDNWTF